jgi:diamine N-acetyltransferase
MTPIKTDRVELRLLTEDDLDLTLAWRNRDDVRRWFKQSDIVSAEAHRAWFAANLMSDDSLMFVVEDAATQAPVGQVSIYNIDREIGEAEVGRFIAAPGASGKGYIRDAIAALVGFAWSELNLQRVYLEVYSENARAVRLYASLDFVEVASTASTQDHGEHAMTFMERRRSASEQS